MYIELYSHFTCGPLHTVMLLSLYWMLFKEKMLEEVISYFWFKDNSTCVCVCVCVLCVVCCVLCVCDSVLCVCVCVCTCMRAVCIHVRILCRKSFCYLFILVVIIMIASLELCLVQVVTKLYYGFDHWPFVRVCYFTMVGSAFRQKLIAEQHCELNLNTATNTNPILNQRYYHHLLVDTHASRSYTFSQAFEKQDQLESISLKKLLLRSVLCSGVVCVCYHDAV